ncbi:MAG: hypothetical protein FJ138_15035, partial [Deltaproteobacteria bacterium]|nr:hypothetical protein [Deltaproteobacteria bacterium]
MTTPDSTPEGAWRVWARPACADALERLPLADRQRLIGACADLELTGAAPLSRPAPPGAPRGWAELHMSGGAGRWWWLVKGGDVWLRAGAPEALPPWPLADPRGGGARPVRPLARLIRSPEQAQVRRALLAREGAALHIDAPGGAGVSWGLALAAADLLSERAGDVLFVTRHPQRVGRLVGEAAPRAGARLHALTPRALLGALLDDGGAPPAPPSPLRHAARFRAWLRKQRALGGPWRAHPDLLYHVITARLWGRDSRDADAGDGRAPDVWPADLEGVPDVWRAAALAVEARARATPLYADFARLARLRRAAPWPWRRVEALVIDDCLDLPWVTLSAILSVAHAQMSERGERWTLVLAGREREALGGGATSWEDLRVFCRSALGRWPERLNLSRSERLTAERLDDLAALCGAYEDLPLPLRPERCAPPARTHRPAPAGEALSPLRCAPWPPLADAGARAQLRALLTALAGAPGGYLLDLTGGELAARLEADAPLPAHERARLITLEALIGDSSLPLGDGRGEGGDGREVEPQTLAVWPPPGAPPHP